MDIYAKNFFLTFPKCDLHPEYALQQFRSLHHASFLQWTFVVQEAHEDGSTHLHAVLSFNKRIRIRDETYFDLWFDDITYHGNYQACRSVKDTLAYLKKDPLASASWGPVPTGSNNAWKVALDTSESQEQFLSQIREVDPMRYVLYYDKVKSYAESHYGGVGSGFGPVRCISDFILPESLERWTADQLNVYSL